MDRYAAIFLVTALFLCVTPMYVRATTDNSGNGTAALNTPAEPELSGFKCISKTIPLETTGYSYSSSNGEGVFPLKGDLFAINIDGSLVFTEYRDGGILIYNCPVSGGVRNLVVDHLREFVYVLTNYNTIEKLGFDGSCITSFDLTAMGVYYVGDMDIDPDGNMILVSRRNNVLHVDLNSMTADVVFSSDLKGDLCISTCEEFLFICEDLTLRTFDIESLMPLWSYDMKRDWESGQYIDISDLFEHTIDIFGFFGLNDHCMFDGESIVISSGYGHIAILSIDGQLEHLYATNDYINENDCVELIDGEIYAYVRSDVFLKISDTGAMKLLKPDVPFGFRTAFIHDPYLFLATKRRDVTELNVYNLDGTELITGAVDDYLWSNLGVSENNTICFLNRYKSTDDSEAICTVMVIT